MTFTAQFVSAVYDWRFGPGSISRLTRLRAKYLITLSDVVTGKRSPFDRPFNMTKDRTIEFEELARLIGYDGQVFEDQQGAS